MDLVLVSHIYFIWWLGSVKLAIDFSTWPLDIVKQLVVVLQYRIKQLVIVILVPVHVTNVMHQIIVNVHIVLHIFFIRWMQVVNVSVLRAIFTLILHANYVLMVVQGALTVHTMMVQEALCSIIHQLSLVCSVIQQLITFYQENYVNYVLYQTVLTVKV